MELKKSISKEEINTLPLFTYTGRIELIETQEHAERVVPEIKAARELGFDTETRPSFSKGQVYNLSLLQLSTKEVAYLFRLNKIKLPKGVIEVLADENVRKAGVGILDDLKALQKQYPFKEAGFVDLAAEAKRLGIQNFGLRALTAIFLGERLSKAAKLTNWDRPTLTEAQLNYAASDAYVGLLIFHRIFG